MKSNLLKISAFLLLSVFTLIYTGCKKENDAPTITLNGDNPQNLTLQGTYVELGATAADPEDGNLSSQIVIDASEVDMNTKGTYSVYYSVTDADGESDNAVRTVNVVNSAESYAGTYSVVDSCGVFPGGQIFTYAQTVTTSNFQNNRIHFDKFADYSGNSNIYATVSGNNIDLPLQTAVGIGSNGDTHTFSGTGFKTANGFFLQYTDVNVTQGNATAQCKAWFSK